MIFKPKSSLKFSGNLNAEEDLSAIAVINDHTLIIGGDEGHLVELLHPQLTNTYKLGHSLRLEDPNQKEADIEDICCFDNVCYVVGSHSRKRKKVDQEETKQDNRERLYKVPKPQPTREVLYRLIYSADSEKLILDKKLSLAQILKEDKLLEQFLTLPSKENGIDIEGLAIKGDRLYVGFRSPVLRDNYVPILSVNAEDLGQPQIDFIQMDGRGVRAMTETHDGFLIIGGPSGDSNQSYQLYFWKGQDMILGKDVPPPKPLTHLGEIDTPVSAKAEGLAVLEENETHWTVLVVYDGVKGGQPSIFEVEKPS